MELIHQHPRELVLAVFDGTPDIPVTVLRRAHLRYGTWTVDLAIIGESHIVTLSRDGAPFFSEMLACVPVDPATCAHAHPFTAMDGHEVARGAYCGRVAFGDPAWELPTPGRSLTLRFPRTNGVVPLTRVAWHLERGRLSWWTLHTYPLAGETVHVHSASTYDLQFAQRKGFST